MKHFFKDKIFHPFLFAAFPVLFLYAENFNMVSGGQAWGPLAIITFFTSIIFLLSRSLFKSWFKAGLLASAFVFLFFLYRPLFSEIQHKPVLSFFTFTRHREFFTLYLLPFLGFIIYLYRSKNTFTKFNQILNVTAIILIIPSLAQISLNWLKPSAPENNKVVTNIKKTTTQTPDIYYFIMDGYGRHDVLKKTFNFNNRPFLDALEKRGFYIAEKSTSNYYQTIQSVSSTLNYDYLTNMADYQDWPKNLNIRAKKIIENSNLRKTLKEINYKYVCYKSGADFTDIKDADYYFTHALELSEFDLALLNTTPLPDVFQKLFSKDLYSFHRETILFPFQNIKKAIEIPDSKFVQIHILSPHPPFVFNQNGNPVQPDRPFNMIDANHFLMVATKAEYLTGYNNQTQFINKQLLHSIDTILKYSKTPPIIIIQGDHGARLNSNFDNIDATNHLEAFANLSAFYFPNQDTTGLYPEISPVNIFRVVLNKYFNTNMPLLPDRNYYSSWPKVFNFTDVTDRVKHQKPPHIN